VLQNGLPYNRIAFTFARHFGTAAERNRARRLGREAYRHIRDGLKPGYDVVLLVYPRKNGAKKEAAQKDVFAVRMEQLKILFSKAGLYGN
jgi:ribonuclease P protein component